MSVKPKDKPLNVVVRNGVLIISIGITTLADCTLMQQRDLLESPDADLGWRFVDVPEFAKDVIRAMTHEDEAGASPLTNFIDKMCIDAIQDGTLGVEFDESE